MYRAELGIDPPTSLTARILAAYERPSVEAVLHLFTSRLGPWPGNAGQLARVLLDEAERGDATARRIVEAHGAALGDYALAAARRVGIERTPFTLVLAGGVLRHPSPLLSAALVARVRVTSPDVQPVDSRFEPAVGALFMALERAGVRVDEALVERLLPTLPPSTLYAT
jgi:N-acetylglucosamine kinase-like BadF-type ATPase